MTKCNHKFNKGFCMLCDNCGLSMGYLLQKAEAENAKLREAAQAVVALSLDMGEYTWVRVGEFDDLAALIKEKSDE